MKYELHQLRWVPLRGSKAERARLTLRAGDSIDRVDSTRKGAAVQGPALVTITRYPEGLEMTVEELPVSPQVLYKRQTRSFTGYECKLLDTAKMGGVPVIRYETVSPPDSEGGSCRTVRMAIGTLESDSASADVVIEQEALG